MHLTFQDIEKTDKITRLNLINSITGIKPANLVGTVSAEGQTNLAIFSSVVHLGSNPPYIAFILRPSGEVKRHTYQNIRDTGVYTINHVHEPFTERAHYTSARFDPEVSEFDACHFTGEYLYGFKAPFVKESQLKLGLSLVEEIPIPLNDTRMIIGRVEHLVVPDRIIEENGHLDLSRIKDVGISGLNSYYSLTKIGQFPYARPGSLPDFD
jgi:flavin reductase (DIM6/NTAB) family NADH-FMN oxidoreductase RutF